MGVGESARGSVAAWRGAERVITRERAGKDLGDYRPLGKGRVLDVESEREGRIRRGAKGVGGGDAGSS